MAADALVRPDARASAAMILNLKGKIRISLFHSFLKFIRKEGKNIFPFNIVNIMTADDLATSGARSSAVMILT